MKALVRLFPALLLALCACHARPTPRQDAGTRISMADLHRSGGVPYGWQLRLQPGNPLAGRQAFVDFGCSTCHTVQGEHFPQAAADEQHAGPDLTGMGGHHPASYFVESILNPDAVLVEGPGYIGPDGHSIMPSYPSMTVAQLADLVAYLQGLGGVTPDPKRFAGSSGGASTFFVQAYEVDQDKFEGFYDWFENQQFRAYPGLVSIDTYVGHRGDRLLVVCVFGFDNDISLGRFSQQLDVAPKSGDFVHPVEHYILQSPATYKALGLIVP